LTKLKERIIVMTQQTHHVLDEKIQEINSKKDEILRKFIQLGYYTEVEDKEHLVNIIASSDFSIPGTSSTSDGTDSTFYLNGNHLTVTIKGRTYTYEFTST